MVVRKGSAGGTVAAAPEEVFAAITDIDRLPAWNTVIQRVTERPETLEPGAEWVVKVKPPGMPAWASRSTVLDLDRTERRFRHRTVTDDGNPSWAVWEWKVDEVPGGSQVTVSWELHPETFFRKIIASRMRNRALRKEVPTSVAALGALIANGAR